jgi:hypothetical protein
MEMDKFTDGKSKPADLVTGPAVAELNAKIDALMESLNADLKTKAKNKCR